MSKKIVMRLPVYLKTLVLLAIGAAGTVSRADAGIITVPPGLSPGDTYRLVFVTSDTTTATSPYIDYYNAFVTLKADSSALAPLDASWMVIGSTEHVSAAFNIDVTDSATMKGIYNVAGQVVAYSTPALFNTNVTELINPIDLDQYGDTLLSYVWTGTLGTTGNTIPYRALGDTDVELGLDWLRFSEYLSEGADSINTASYYLYAISSPLTVSPEPSAFGLSALGGAILLLARRRKQENQRATPTHH